MNLNSLFSNIPTLTLFFLLLLSFSSTQLHAQPTSHAQTTKSPNHRLLFSVYPIGKTNWNDLYYQVEPGDYRTLTFWSYERSPRHEYKGPFPIEFFRKFENPDPSGPPIYKSVATAQPHTRSDECLLFFIATHHGKSPEDETFQIVPLDESHSSFPIDTVTFVNATGANLEGVFGNKPILLKTGVSTPYDLRPFFKKETLLGLAVQVEDSLKKVLHSKWNFFPDYREVILLLPPPKTHSLRIQAFRITQHKEEISPPAATTAGKS